MPRRHGQHATGGRRPRTDGRRALWIYRQDGARLPPRRPRGRRADIEAVRRELVRRAVEAEKASGEVVPFGPPPRPADEGAAAGPAEIFEREARAEHEKVRVVAAATHAGWSSTTADSKKVKIGLDNLLA